MSIPSPRYLASLSIEELSQQPNLQQQNWLLTYVDVFILIIMLVITLMALSNFESEVKQQKTQVQVKKRLKEITHQPIKSSSNKPVKKHKPLITPATKPIETQQKSAGYKKITSELATPITQTKDQPITKQSPPNTIKESLPPTQVKKNDLQKKLVNTLSELGLTDSVKMKVSLGYAQLEIQDKILFKSSEATLIGAGEDLLKKLTILLKQSTGLIYIEGHTDNRPIKTEKFPSNWELGASRATSVLHYLSSQKLDTTRLRAITYGSTKPIADNSTKEGREKNRRVSLVIKMSDKID